MPRLFFRGIPWIILIGALLLLGVALLWIRKKESRNSAFTASMIAGRNAFENADAPRAISEFAAAARAHPSNPDAHLNLANACLLAGESAKAIAEATEVLRLDKNSAAALYVAGCAYLRLGDPANALKALEQSWFIDDSVAATSFHIGRAHQALGQWDAAVAAFQQTIALEPQHTAAHYALSQAALRTNDKELAQQEIKRHREIAAQRRNVPNDVTFYEKCVHTAARLPAVEPEQPDPRGIAVRFVDDTTSVFGEKAKLYAGPIGVIDAKARGIHSVIVVEQGKGARLLANQGGKFAPVDEPLPIPEGARQCLVADLNNDTLQDAVVLSPNGAAVFQLTKEGQLTDTTGASGLSALRTNAAVLADLDFTGKLGLIAATAEQVTVWRNQGNAVFNDITAQLPFPPLQVHELHVDDWNGDDLPDLFVVTNGKAPQLFLNQHGGPLKAATGAVERMQPLISQPAAPPQQTSLETPWPAGGSCAIGDVDCDGINDLVVSNDAGFDVLFHGTNRIVHVSGASNSQLLLRDYDNDGWLDVVATGNTLRVWRNHGRDGFREVSTQLGLENFASSKINAFAAADFDHDGDTDWLIAIAGEGLRFLRNDGGNANLQLKVQLIGQRSNASNLGARLELIAGGWRTVRSVTSLPIEIGVGQHAKLDSFAVHTTDLVMNLGALAIDPKSPVTVTELELPTGSCPYLYVWDGAHFRFVTDLLGAAPAGLRATDDHFIDADTEELVHVGNDTNVHPRDGAYVFQITDELRELLFFDHVELVVVDHRDDVAPYSTSKLRPGKPFPPHELVALRNAIPLRTASQNDAADVRDALSRIDGIHVSPAALRAPQLRGLAEPHHVTLDFGPLPVDRPLALALTGWLRFGGGMANVAASHDPSLPFPFPRLEVETQNGEWKAVDVVAGAPAGKTKSIVIDLDGKLPPGAQRLRLSTAFEIHWDHIALYERASADALRVSRIPATSATLHYRGSAEYAQLPWSLPITPVYDKLRPAAPWLRLPAGWCTRYGDVKELVEKRDDALVILNCGDEMTVTFSERALPEKRAGIVRDFFLFTSGWDKDGDYHVESGLTVEPIPWHAMDDQKYGHQARPAFANDAWISKYNTRWVGPLTLTQRARAGGNHKAAGHIEKQNRTQ